MGLWHEVHGDEVQARQAILAAIATPYARQSGDYMAALGRTHAVRTSAYIDWWVYHPGGWD